MKLLNHDYKPFLDEFMIIFINDVLIYAWTKEGHNQRLFLVLELLKLYIKFYKCELYIRKLYFPKHLFNNEGTHVEYFKNKATF